MQMTHIPWFYQTTVFLLSALLAALADGDDDLWQAGEAVDERIQTQATGSEDPVRQTNAAGHENNVTTFHVDAGYVFVDGRYVPPPYTIRQTGEELTINERAIRGDIPGPAGIPSHLRSEHDPSNARATGAAAERSGVGSAAQWIAHHLESECVVVDLPHQPVVDIEPGDQLDRFFAVLWNSDIKSQQCLTLLANLPPGTDRQLWVQWLSDFTPTEALRGRIYNTLKNLEADRETADADQSAAQRSPTLAYPIMALGMIMSVLSVGHLMTSLPSSAGRDASGRQRATMISILLLLVLSGMDLAWTIFANQTGQMRELKPLGSRFVGDPDALIAFKIVAMVVSCWVLISLRHRFSARLISWSLCAAFTLMTLRWVIFNPLFMS